MSNTTTTTSTASGSGPNPSEVGWQFVPQYYTFVNKQPQRLHCFYSKNSTFSHGTEGEDGRPCYGQQEIHNKILSIGFQDCKVYIHSVDAQASANGGIIIQVIGEMSNNGEAWRKFVQTFFLAEQPNGYFVLNDIFRFLKEETADDEDGSEVGAETDNLPAPPTEPPITELAPPAIIPVKVVPEVAVPTEIPSAPVIEPVRPQPNGYHHPNADKATDVSSSPVESSTQLPETDPVVEVEPVVTAPVVPPPAPVAPVSQPTAHVSTPVAPTTTVSDVAPLSQINTPPPAPSQTTTTTTAPTAPQAPKTWANLAATNSKKWGAAVAQESRGLSEVVAPATPSTSAPPSGTQTPVTSGRAGQGTPQGRDRDHRTPHPAVVQANSVTTSQVFIKGVTERISDSMLIQTLTNRFGPVGKVEIARNKACAFAEFLNIDHAKRAIVVSLPVNQGGEGGIRVDVADGNPVRIVAEVRKERGDRPAPRPRGGAPGNGEQRGGFRGRGGGGRGRGNDGQQAGK